MESSVDTLVHATRAASEHRVMKFGRQAAIAGAAGRGACERPGPPARSLEREVVGGSVGCKMEESHIGDEREDDRAGD